MKLFVDESLSQRLALILRESGHDAVHAADGGLLGAQDEAAMAAATREDRVLPSADTDFGELLALGRHPGPSVVMFRRTPRRPEVQAALLLAALPDAGHDLAEGAVMVLTPGRARLRRLLMREE